MSPVGKDEKDFGKRVKTHDAFGSGGAGGEGSGSQNSLSVVCRDSDLFSEVRLAFGSGICQLLEESVPEGACGGTRPPASGSCQLTASKQPASKGSIERQP